MTSYLTCAVCNKGIGWETSGDGLKRINCDLKECQPNIAIIHFGVADYKKGIIVKEIFKNLSRIIEICKKKDVRVILFGFKLPELSHLRDELYSLTSALNIKVNNDFFDMYKELANLHQIDFFPDFYEGILGEKGMMIENDGHLTAKGYSVFVDNILPTVIKNIDIVFARRF